MSACWRPVRIVTGYRQWDGDRLDTGLGQVGDRLETVGERFENIWNRLETE
jgi:hypothetical protein